MSIGQNYIGDSDFVTLARLATSGRRQDVVAFIRRVANRSQKYSAQTSSELLDLVELESGTPLRNIGAALPVDLDSRHELLRIVHPKQVPTPILSKENYETLIQILDEHQNIQKLQDARLHPTRTVLFTGPPGVGKTLSAKWVSSQLNVPLMVLDLSAVMSSYLGRTGGNLKAVIEYAKNTHGVLLLDEFDAVAKRRDDSIEVGELKRLVTVLLQEFDSWPDDGLIIAATNHEELLDPAIWRRFDIQMKFSLPTVSELREAVERYIGDYDLPKKDATISAIAAAFVGKSFNDVEREIHRTRRESLLKDLPIDEMIKSRTRELCSEMKPSDRKAIAIRLCESGFTQMQAHEWTNVARATIRDGIKNKKGS